MIQRCIAVTGRVTRVRHEQDGDFHVDIALAAPFASLVNARNRSEQRGALVVEIISADQAGVTKPKAGAHVRVVGPYVLDRDHGWMEIHPVWAIKPS